MDDLISRQLTIDEINALHELPNAWLDSAVDAVTALPSAQSERKKGKWVHLGGDEWCCSSCGHVIFTEGSWEHPLEREIYYCEHCGSEMETNDVEVH